MSYRQQIVGGYFFGAPCTTCFSATFTDVLIFPGVLFDFSISRSTAIAARSSHTVPGKGQLSGFRRLASNHGQQHPRRVQGRI